VCVCVRDCVCVGEGGASVCEQKQKVCVCKFVGVFDLNCHIKKNGKNNMKIKIITQ
jgi:hypothetical protein